jgi:hypothetical protein
MFRRNSKIENHRKKATFNLKQNQSFKIYPRSTKPSKQKKQPFFKQGITVTFLTISSLLSILSLGLIFAPSLFSPTATVVAKADKIKQAKKPKIITDFSGCNLNCTK